MQETLGDSQLLQRPTALYYIMTKAVCEDLNGVTEMFDIGYTDNLTGVRQQGCILLFFLFLIVTDFIMRKTTHGQVYGIQLGPGKLADLDFADDITLISNTRDALQDNHRSPEQWYERWTTDQFRED